MMYHQPSSYNDLKAQIQERVDYRLAMLPGEIVTRGRIGPARRALGWLGGQLVRLGSRIEQAAQVAVGDSQIPA